MYNGKSSKSSTENTLQPHLEESYTELSGLIQVAFGEGFDEFRKLCLTSFQFFLALKNIFCFNDVPTKESLHSYTLFKTFSMACL